MIFLLLHDFKVIRQVKWRLAELVYFPVTTIVIWGFFAKASRESAFSTALAVLAVNVLWNFASVAQSTTNMQIMEDIWSGNLRQILLTGVTSLEYIVARIIFAQILAVPMGVALVALAVPFGLTVNGMYGEAAAVTAMTAIASSALALVVAGAVFTLGRDYGFLAWTFIQMFVLLSAPFNPPEIFPQPLEFMSRFMPFTDAFRIARCIAAAQPVGAAPIVRGFVAAACYVAVGLPVYFVAFRRARRTGMLTKL
jgi:ABC-type polysaccharide/polyol phosphate export permease